MNDTGYFRDGATTAHRNGKSAEISALQASLWVRNAAFLSN